MIQLGYLRAKTGLTQKEFGEKLGVKSGTIAKYEKGGTPPPTLLKLIRYEFSEHLEGEGLEMEIRDEFPRPSWEEYEQCQNEKSELSLQLKQLKEFKNKVILLEREKKSLREQNDELQLKLQAHNIKY